MADKNATLGEDLKIYDPMFESIKRQLNSQSTVQGQKELDQLKGIATSTASGEAGATTTADKSRIASMFGTDSANANMGDIQTRQQRVQNAFNNDLYDSERRFYDAIKTQGLGNALKMFDTQLGAQTDTNVANIQGQTQLATNAAEQSFVGQQSELDRILNRELYQNELQIQSIQAKQQKKSQQSSAMGGLFGSILGIGALLL